MGKKRILIVEDEAQTAVLLRSRCWWSQPTARRRSRKLLAKPFRLKEFIAAVESLLTTDRQENAQG